MKKLIITFCLALPLSVFLYAQASVIVPSAYEPKPFTVAEGKQVTFSCGNLQYTQSTNTYAFATRQTDYIGEANVTTDTDGNKVLADKIDLFGWGTGNNPTNLSINTDDYQTFVDWGTNTIGTDAPNTWRTLTTDEWFYIFFHRTNAEKLFSLATVNDIEGLIILPDDWTTPDGVAFTSSTEKGLQKNETNYCNPGDETEQHFTDNIYTAADWQKLEAAGAVFLSAAGARAKDTTISWQSAGFYWSATPQTTGKKADTKAKVCYLSRHGVSPIAGQYRYLGYSVRLVKDCVTEESAYTPKPFTVAEGKQVTFSGGNLQYTQSTDTWSFATRQTDYIGDANVTTDTDGNKVLADKIDLFGWGTGNNPTNASPDKNDYQTFVDWGTNAIGTDAPNTWRTLTADEWFYIFFYRTNAEKLFSLSTVNDITGLIILPDDWTTPDGVAFTPSTEKGLPKNNTNYCGNDETDYRYTDNIYTAADWQKLEAAGAVFLSAAGEREKDTTVYVQEPMGNYWSATPETKGKWADKKAKTFYLSPRAVTPAIGLYRYYGRSVRLVKDYSNVSTGTVHPSATDTSEVRKVLRNGQVFIMRNGKTYTLTGVEVR